MYRKKNPGMPLANYLGKRSSQIPQFSLYGLSQPIGPGDTLLALHWASIQVTIAALVRFF